MPTTEVASFPLKADAKPGDPENPAAGIVKAAFDTIRQQNGVQQIHFGLQVENPNIFQLFINWDGIENHKDFMASSTYQPFLKSFESIVEGDSSMSHVDFQPASALNTVLSAPVTEIVTFYFDGVPPPAYSENVEKFAKVAEEKKVDGYQGLAYGFTHEEVEKDGIKGKAAVLAIGWQSVDKHMAFRNTQAFGDSIPLIRSTSNKAAMQHVAFLQAQ